MEYRERWFLLFSGDDYYPSGGLFDYKGQFESIEDAKSRLVELGSDWANIGLWNGKSLEIVAAYMQSTMIPGGVGWIHTGEELFADHAKRGGWPNT